MRQSIQTIQRLAFVTLFAAVACFAQTYSGELRGRVTDESGAVIAAANVALRNEATNVTISTRTNGDGEYVFPSLNPATYTIEVKAEGFAPSARTGIIVETQGQHTVDLVLSIGAATQSVNVSSEQEPLMDTVVPSTGQHLTSRQIEDLPDAGRNVFMLLARVSPNVVSLGSMLYDRFQDQSGVSQVSVAGSPGYSNNFLIDGIPVTETQNRTSIIPPIESVEEIRMQTNTYDAEMGRTAGGVFNTFLKSGSDVLHGAIFGDMRNADWAANNFFTNRAGLPRPIQKWRDFGGAIGGPIIIPKIYNGKNRTFFWLSRESYRQLLPENGTQVVPTLLERQGDFSRSFNKDGSLHVIYDPSSGLGDSSGNFVRTPFPGNVIPSSRLDAIGQKVASYYPAPTTAPAYYGAPDYTVQSTQANRGDEWTGKLSQQFTSRWSASLSYLHSKTQEPGPDLLSSIASPSQSTLLRKVDATAVNSTFILGPSSVLDVRWGFNRFPNQYVAISAGFNPAQLGFPASIAQNAQYLKFPRFDMQTFAPLGDENDSALTIYHSNNFSADISKLFGKHDLKAGFSYRQLSIDTIPFGYSSGEFAFNDTFTRKNYAAFDGNTGSDLTSLLLGLATSGQAQTSAEFFNYIHYYAGFVQDNYRLSKRLTLNLGLRIESETGIADRHNALIVGFNPTAANPISQSVGYQVNGVLEYAGVNGNPTSVMNPTAVKLGPRVGVAWQLNDKTTIRGGYGRFWAPITYSGTTPLGYTQITNFVGTVDGGRTAVTNINNPFPNGFLKPVGNALGTSAGLGQGISYIDQNSRSPYVDQFSAGVQRVLPGQVLLDVGYVGSRSHQLSIGTGTVNIDQLPLSAWSLGSALLSSVPNPFYNHGGVVNLASPTITMAQSLLPFPEFTSVGRQFSDFNHARYDSLDVKAERRFAKGFSFVSTWTWAKNWDAAWATVSGQNPGNGGPQNAYNLNAEYSLSLNHIPHRVTVGMVYDLPFGKGRTWLNNNRALNWIVGGWQFNLIALFQAGFPLAVVQPNQNGSTGAAVQRPNATGVSPMPSNQTINSWINPAAFSLAAPFTLGNLSRTISLEGPRQRNFDISLFKSVTFFERFNAQFRAEALNAFNTPDFAQPNAVFATPAFGIITSQQNQPRLIQLGLRFSF